MASKSALVLGMCNYDDVQLARLHAPSSDVKALAKVLKDDALGGFEDVTEYTDEGRSVVEVAITQLFADKQQDDLVVLYFSGHGLKDDEGDLYLAVKDTKCRNLLGTAVAADFIKRAMNKSNSRRQVLILDCCHSGAFSAGFKGGSADGTGAKVGTKAAFDPDGFGRIILTASDATQYAWEGEQFKGEAQTSLYTGFLIEGIRSGAADLSRDGMITVDELHDYVYKKTVESTSKQRPTKICDREKGNLILSRAPLHASPLPEDVTSALRSPFATVRQAMVGNLVEMFQHQPAGTAISAYKALAAMAEDDSKAVRQAAEQAIAACRGARPEIDPSLLGEIVLASAGTTVETPGQLLEMQKKQQEDAREAKRVLENLAGKVERELAERATANELMNTVFASDAAKTMRTTLPDRKPDRSHVDAFLKQDVWRKTASTGDSIDTAGLAQNLKKHEEEMQAAEKTRAEMAAAAERSRLDRIAATALIRRDHDAGKRDVKAPDRGKVETGADVSHGTEDAGKSAPLQGKQIEKVRRIEPVVAVQAAVHETKTPDSLLARIVEPLSFAASPDGKKKSRWLVWVYRVIVGFGVLMSLEIVCTGYFMMHPVPATTSTTERAATSTVDTKADPAKQGPSKVVGRGLMEACVFNPVSNVRSLPTDSSPIVCRIQTVKTITVHNTPLAQGKGEWWQTEECGETGFIAGNQVHTDAGCP